MEENNENLNIDNEVNVNPTENIDTNESVDTNTVPEMNSVPEVNTVPEVNPIPEVTPITEPTVSIDTEVSNETEEQPKKKNNPIIIVLLLIVLAGAVGYYFYNSSNKNNNAGKDKPAEVTQKPTASSLRMSGNGLEDFDLSFMKLENKNQNLIYSPLSIKYALAMLSEGANGDTKTQITDVIGDYKSKKYTNSKHMSLANAMFIRDTYKDNIKKDYVSNLKSKFNAEVITDSFKSPKTINKWVNNKTLKLINSLYDDVSNFDFILVNALAIDMNWKNQIHCASTFDIEDESQYIPCMGGYYSLDHEKLKGSDNDDNYERYDSIYDDMNPFPKIKFNGKDGYKGSSILGDFNRYDIIKELGEKNIKKTVTDEYKKWYKKEYKTSPSDKKINSMLKLYMEELKANYGRSNISTDFYMYYDDDVQVFAKDLKKYDGMTLQYVGIMPKKVELSKYIENIKADDINSLISKMYKPTIDKMQDGVLTIFNADIPLFKYDTELDLIAKLQELGINNVFEDKADLSNMVSGPAKITDVTHKATIEFGNDGIKAAALTAGGGAGASGADFDYFFEIPYVKVDLSFDKPYMYIIRDKETGEVWFAGTVYEPEVNTAESCEKC